MKTPKEYANELVEKYLAIKDINFHYTTTLLNPREAVECAIICCKEVLNDMGADRGYEFWTNVLYELEHYES